MVADFVRRLNTGKLPGPDTGLTAIALRESLGGSRNNEHTWIFNDTQNAGASESNGERLAKTLGFMLIAIAHVLTPGFSMIRKMLAPADYVRI